MAYNRIIQTQSNSKNQDISQRISNQQDQRYKTGDLQFQIRLNNSKYPPYSVCGQIGHSNKGCYEVIDYPDR